MLLEKARKTFILGNKVIWWIEARLAVGYAVRDIGEVSVGSKLRCNIGT